MSTAERVLLGNGGGRMADVEEVPQAETHIQTPDQSLSPKIPSNRSILSSGP